MAYCNASRAEIKLLTSLSMLHQANREKLFLLSTPFQ